MARRERFLKVSRRIYRRAGGLPLRVPRSLLLLARPGPLLGYASSLETAQPVKGRHSPHPPRGLLWGQETEAGTLERHAIRGDQVNDSRQSPKEAPPRSRCILYLPTMNSR